MLFAKIIAFDFTYLTNFQPNSKALISFDEGFSFVTISQFLISKNNIPKNLRSILIDNRKKNICKNEKKIKKIILKKFTKKELYNADEVFITSSGSLITPIIQVDKYKINNGKIGIITKTLALNLYKSIIK